MTDTTHIHTARALALALTLALAGVLALLRPDPAVAYGWPVKPFDREHPVRGSFGDPRTLFHAPPTMHGLLHGGGSFSFHQGVDIAAPNGTAVYPVESGTVARVAGEWVRIDSGGGRAFEYWHIRPQVAVGQRVEAYATVLGRILRPAMHVHLTHLEDGRPVNPLARGRLTPYADRTTPRVTSIEFRDRRGREVLASFVRGPLTIVVGAEDLPSMPVPGIWNGLPVTPACLTWQIRAWTGKVVVRRRVAVDHRARVPERSRFWRVYARGTYQNMAVFGPHYSYLQRGNYLFRLTASPLDTRRLRDGVYDLVVTAEDIAGNRDTLVRRFTVHNRPGWVGS